MPKAKSKTNKQTREQSPVPHSDSTCGLIHPLYSHGNLNDQHIKSIKKEHIYWCPEKKTIPNPMHNKEFLLHIIECEYCQKRTGNFGSKKPTQKK